MNARTSVSRPRRSSHALAVGLACLALAGCVRVDAATELDSDDTFSQHLVVAFAPDIADQLDSGMLSGLAGGTDTLPDDELPEGLALDDFTPADLYDEVASSEEFTSLEDEFPGQVELEAYDDGELVGIELTLTDLPLALYEDAAQTAAGEWGFGGTITHEDGQFVVIVPADESRDASALGLNAANLALLANAVDVSVSFTFPGLVTEAPDGTAEGRTATLGVAELMSPDEIRIVASDADQIYWTPILTWGGIILAAIVILGGATLLVLQDVRARRRSHLPAPDSSHESRIGTLGPDKPQAAPDSATDDE